MMTDKQEIAFWKHVREYVGHCEGYADPIDFTGCEALEALRKCVNDMLNTSDRRDRFVVAALQGLLANSANRDADSIYVHQAVRIADLCIEELKTGA